MTDNPTTTPNEEQTEKVNSAVRIDLPYSQRLSSYQQELDDAPGFTSGVGTVWTVVVTVVKIAIFAFFVCPPLILWIQQPRRTAIPPRPRSTVIVSEAAQETILTTSFTCQRIEPSLPVTCEQDPCTQSSFFGRCSETQTRSFELLEARGISPWVVLITDKDPIFFGHCSIRECKEIRDAINGFIENPDEDASLDRGGVKLTVEEGRLTVEP